MYPYYHTIGMFVKRFDNAFMERRLILNN